MSTMEVRRRQAERRMLDTWVVSTSGTWTYNQATGKDARTPTPLFTTKARLKVVTAQARESQAGERTVIEARRELHIPVGSPDVPINAIAECTAVHPTTDPTVLGTIVRLSGPAPGSQTTARRLEVVEVLS